MELADRRHAILVIMSHQPRHTIRTHPTSESSRSLIIYLWLEPVPSQLLRPTSISLTPYADRDGIIGGLGAILVQLLENDFGFAGLRGRIGPRSEKQAARSSAVEQVQDSGRVS